MHASLSTTDSIYNVLSGGRVSSTIADLSTRQASEGLVPAQQSGLDVGQLLRQAVEQYLAQEAQRQPAAADIW